MIRALVVEDSPTVREFLVQILSSDPGMTVVGTAKDGREALEAVERHRPDVITMDINMPRMNGFEATRKIMETNPTPIVIVSGNVNGAEARTSFLALEAGALSVVPRPCGAETAESEESRQSLIQTVKLMSEVKVVRRWRLARSRRSQPHLSPRKETEAGRIDLVAIGASTGGPNALKRLLTGLSAHFPAPLVIVQHMTPGFVEGFGQWLSESTGVPTRVAVHGDRLVPGRALLAPDGFHLGLGSRDRVVLSDALPENSVRPAVSYLFRSVGALLGCNCAGVLLSGMGRDGVDELGDLKLKGGVTVAQDEKTSAVFGMPGEAVRLHAADYILAPEQIAELLKRLSAVRLKERERER
jgi:two-component system chemotaxis response regulator CheB